MALKRGRRHTAVEKVLARFVELASQIPEVQRILLADDTDEGLRVWTVIDAPGFEPSCRRRVYLAQYSAWDSVEEPPVDFRLINVQELKHPLHEVLPPAERILFERP